MGRVLIRKDASMAMAPTVQTNVGGAGSPFFITPRERIEPSKAGMRAAMQRLRGMRGISPEQGQTVLDSATRGAERASGLVQGKRGLPSLGMLGLAGLKNIYDASIQGRAPSVAGTFGDAYGMAQYAQPFATSIGSEVGARRGFNEARRQAADAKAAERTGSPAGADFSMPEGASMDMFNIAPPTRYDSTQDSPLARAGLGNIDPTMMSGDARAYGRSGAPSMSMQQFRQQMPSFSPPPRQTTLDEFTPPAIASPTPPAPQGMAEKLESALPEPPNPMQQSMDLMRENQKKREEEKEKMEEEQREKLAEDMREQRLLGTGTSGA